MLSFSTIWFSPESDLGHKKGGAGEKLAWKEQNGSDQKLSNLEKEVDHDHLTKDVEVLPMTHFSGSILPQNVFIRASIFPWSPSLSAVFLGSRMSSTPDYSSITGWFGTKKSSKIHSTKRRGSQQATSHKLWSECTVVAKQTLPRGKEKHSFGMWRKKGPRAGGGGMGEGGAWFYPILWILAFLHVLPRVSAGYDFFF